METNKNSKDIIDKIIDRVNVMEHELQQYYEKISDIDRSRPSKKYLIKCAELHQYAITELKRLL